MFQVAIETDMSGPERASCSLGEEPNHRRREGKIKGAQLRGKLSASRISATPAETGVGRSSSARRGALPKVGRSALTKKWGPSRLIQVFKGRDRPAGDHETATDA